MSVFFIKGIINMEEFFKDDEFAHFILTEYLPDNEMTDMQKLEKVGESYESFFFALECWKLKGGIFNKH